jgi:hypothetical protein
MSERPEDIIARRLRNQRLTTTELRTPEAIVAAFGAVQAQEYAIAKWGVAQRSKKLTDQDVERAFTDGRILRTHVMRPTWHFVSPADIHWMLALTAPRVNALMATYDRRLELDARVYARSHDAIARALEGGVFLTRAEIAAVLGRARIRASGQRLAHIVMRAEMDRVVTSGPRRGKHFTYALLAERAPTPQRLSRDESLAELARRYFSTHGPATVKDFAWWSGLTMGDARLAIELVKPGLLRESQGALVYWSVPSRRALPPPSPTAYLLPIYDEYLIAYKDRDLVTAALRERKRPLVTQDAFAFHLVLDGVLAGDWRRAIDTSGVRVAVRPYSRLTREDVRGIHAAAARLGAFAGQPVEVTIAS